MKKIFELEKNFQLKIENDIKIEPNDWMPDEYRKTELILVEKLKKRVCG
jgi:hypothetical protein